MLGNTITFSDDEGHVYDEKEELVVVATKKGNLYYLNCLQSTHQQVNAIWKKQLKSKESIWHRRFGHLREKSLRELAKNKLADGFDYNLSNDIESCVLGKLHRSPFSKNGRKRADFVLNLVHSDVRGKLSTQSLGGAEYFLTFIDDRSHYTWVYVMNHKSEVLQKFIEWKLLLRHHPVAN